MIRSEFVKIALDNPKKAAKLLRAQARKLEKAKGIIKINDAISETLFISQRSVYRDCSK